MKRLRGIVLVAMVAILVSSTLAGASSGDRTIEVFFRGIQLVVNGIAVRTADEPFIYEGRTYLPLRAVAEAMGLDVQWDGDTNTVYIGRGGAQATGGGAGSPQPAGSRYIDVTYANIRLVVNGVPLFPADEPFIYNGRTYLPIRAVAEALGQPVKWDGETRTVYLGAGAQIGESTEAAKQDVGRAPLNPVVITVPERIRQAGKLVFASDTTYPPMEYIAEDNRTIVGFDADIVAEIGRRMGIKAEIITAEWDGLIPGLQARRYDAIISSMNITGERLQQVDFVEYTKLSQIFVVKKGAPPVRNDADLVGKVVAVQVSTTNEDYARSVPGVKEVRSFPSFADAFIEVENGRADVTIADEPVGLFYVTTRAGIFDVTGLAVEPLPVGIAINKDDQELRQAIADSILAMKIDGTFARIAEKWFSFDLTIR